MSKTSQVAIGILVAVAIIAGTWYAVAGHHSLDSTTQSAMPAYSQPSGSAVSGTEPSTSAAANKPASPPATSDDSDASISQGLHDVDTQMSGMDTDNANAQQSMNQK